MLVEAPVLGGDHGVLQVRGNARQRDPHRALVVIAPVQPCLDPTLDLQGGCTWIDETEASQGSGRQLRGGNRSFTAQSVLAGVAGFASLFVSEAGLDSALDSAGVFPSVVASGLEDARA
jgi:hypothetical protein